MRSGLLTYMLGVGCAVLALALAVVAIMPAPGHAASPGATSDPTAPLDRAGSIIQTPAHHGASTQSCHPEVDCSPSAIFAAGPSVWKARIRGGKRRLFAAYRPDDLTGFVDLPPPRTGAGLQSRIKRRNRA